MTVIHIDLDFPDGFAEAYPDADIVTLGMFNHERKKENDGNLDSKTAPAWDDQW